METKSSSVTALRVALRREAHQIMYDPKVFSCPLAFRILGAKNQSKQQLDPKLPEQNPSESRYRAYLAECSRYAEDEIHSTVKRGVQQYVVPGAGLDTFACRNPYPDSEARHILLMRWFRQQASCRNGS